MILPFRLLCQVAHAVVARCLRLAYAYAITNYDSSGVSIGIRISYLIAVSIFLILKTRSNSGVRNLGSTSSMELTGGGTSSPLIQRSCSYIVPGARGFTGDFAYSNLLCFFGISIEHISSA
ncbi:hypothetical protein [uncultured Nostoc sp.]|uniref:hypothetical protein n=1 Tax=uncultured Nostoc sp. TaxID=340711 RepID=UPI0035CBFAFC